MSKGKSGQGRKILIVCIEKLWEAKLGEEVAAIWLAMAKELLKKKI